MGEKAEIASKPYLSLPVKMLKESADRIQKAANAILSQIEATGGRVATNLQAEAV